MDQDTAKFIVELLEQDLSDRVGLGDEWDQTTDDIKQEIRDEWVEIILENS